MIHEGEEQLLALELASDQDGKLALRLTIPAMNLARLPVGSLEPTIEGIEVTLGPFVFTYDGEAQTLSGTLPSSLVPLYEIPVTLHRVETIEAPSRPGPSAPLVEPAWLFDAGASLWAGATFAEGVVYAGDDQGRLHALDAGSGAERWRFQAGGPIRTRPTISDEAIFFQADDGILYRLDAESGKEVWKVRVVEAPVERLPPGDPKSRYDSFGSDVTVAEKRLVIGTHDGQVLALDPGSGKQLWKFSAGDSVLAAPVVSSGRVYFGSFDGHVHALDAATGHPLWKHDTRGAVLSTPAMAGDLLVVGNRSYDLLALDAQTGEMAWKQYIWFSWVESSATVRDGVVYIGSSDAAAAFAFDAHTGKRLWKTDVYGWAWGQPAVAGDRVFVGTAALRGYQNDVHRGGVTALELSTGRAVWRYALEPPTEGAWGFPGSPAVGAGHVFFTGIDGRVVALPQ
jgi:outer membrane protein assembly factor BamB